MMKKIKLIITMLLVTTTFITCEETDTALPPEQAHQSYATPAEAIAHYADFQIWRKTTPIEMRLDGFLYISGIEGESTAKGYEKWIELHSFSFGYRMDLSLMGATSGSGTGKVSLSDFKIIKSVDKSSPVLAKMAKSGQRIPYAELTLRKVGNSEQKGAELKIEFEDVLISSYSTGSGGGTDDSKLETIELSFQKISWE